MFPFSPPATLVCGVRLLVEDQMWRKGGKFLMSHPLDKWVKYCNSKSAMTQHGDYRRLMSCLLQPPHKTMHRLHTRIASKLCIVCIRGLLHFLLHSLATLGVFNRYGISKAGIGITYCLFLWMLGEYIAYPEVFYCCKKPIKKKSSNNSPVTEAYAPQKLMGTHPQWTAENFYWHFKSPTYRLLKTIVYSFITDGFKILRSINIGYKTQGL